MFTLNAENMKVTQFPLLLLGNITSENGYCHGGLSHIILLS